jgi:hypothetical protein
LGIPVAGIPARGSHFGIPAGIPAGILKFKFLLEGSSKRKQ